VLGVAMLVGALGGCSLLAPETPARPTLLVAGETESPTTPPSEPASTPVASLGASLQPPSEDPGATPGTGIVPGSVNRSSLSLTATYDVNALITVSTGVLEMATLIQVRNDSGTEIDRLELNTIAAAIGQLRVTDATVDDVPVRVRVQGQTLFVPLGGVLPPGATATVRIGHRAKLATGVSGSDWMFTRFGGTLALNRWIPWISRATPFDHPRKGDPYMTTTSPQVDIEIVTDERMVLAAPARDIVQVAAGAGVAWAFTVRDVRDVSVVLAPDFDVARGTAAGVPIRVYSRSGFAAGERLLDLARSAVIREAEILGVDYPWPVLVVVESQGGEGLESPALVWIPRTLDSLNRTYEVHHEVAHQWFYALVGSDQQAQPFADEGPADLLARTALGTIRASRCAESPLDRAITRYAEGCYYEVVYVQSGLLLEEIRQRIGTRPFWKAMRAYLDEHRLGVGGTKVLLDTLRDASEVNLLPLLRSRFPSLY
jgi:hypothetical protein